MENNTENEYLHFVLGKKDDEKRDLFWFFRNLTAYLRWVYLMFAQKDTLIHFNLPLSILSILRDSPLILFTRILRKPMIIHIHGGELLTGKKSPIWLKYILKWSLSGKNPKIVLSAAEEEVLRRKFSSRRIFVLPNCIELKEAREFNGKHSKSEMLKVLFMGRISAAKGLEYIFQGFECLKRKGIKFGFIMAGKGPEEKIYVRKFRELLGEEFEYRGVVSGDQKAELLKECNVFLLPSLFEGLPMALIESMAFGLVPVVTNVGSIKCVVSSGINGIIVKKDSSEEIAGAIEKLTQDRQYLKELSRNARQYIFSNYNPDVYITRLNEIYDNA